MILFLFIGLIGLQLGGVLAAGENVEKLQRIPNVPPRPQTISGFSSGGSMASQMQVAFSQNFDGAALFAAIWYRCGPGGEIPYRSICSKGLRNVSEGIRDATAYEKSKKIDPLKNLQNQSLFHFIPNDDDLIKKEIRSEMKTFYEKVGMNSANIKFVERDAHHCMPTTNTMDPSCNTSQIVDDILGNQVGACSCDYYGAYEGMNYIFNNTLTRPTGNVTLEKLRFFDQSAFLGPFEKMYMDPVGFLYVPSKCKDGSIACPLHVALHGCSGSRSNVQTRFATRSGYLEVAEVNNIILLLPQSIPFPGNVLGCWDIAGYSGDNYATKLGPQTKALAKMISAITGASFNFID